jgi:hypothetical protein
MVGVDCSDAEGGDEVVAVGRDEPGLLLHVEFAVIFEPIQQNGVHHFSGAADVVLDGCGVVDGDIAVADLPLCDCEDAVVLKSGAAVLDLAR